MLIKELATLNTGDELHLFLAGEEFGKFDMGKYQNVFKYKVDSSHYSFKEQAILPFQLSKRKVDIMHFPHFNAPVLYRGRCVVTVHDLIHQLFPGKKASKLKLLAYNRVIGSAIARAKMIIAVSEATKDDIIKFFNVRPEKIRVIHESVDREPYYKLEDDNEIRQAITKYGISTEKPYLLYTGVSRSHKNIVGLIKAFKILRDKMGQDVDLVLTGKKDPAYPEIDREIQRQGVGNHVVRTGFVDEKDLPHIYNGADAFVFPTFYEGFGLPPLEAQSCGTPVVCSNVASVPEIVGDAGVYFDPKDARDMAEKIKRVLTDEKLRAELSEKGFKNLERFSWKKMAEKTYQVYREAAGMA